MDRIDRSRRKRILRTSTLSPFLQAKCNVEVQAFILDFVPKTKRPHDANATVYVHASVLRHVCRELGVVAGRSVCYVSSTHNQPGGIPIVLDCMSNENTIIESSKSKTAVSGKIRVFMSPCLAASAGLYNFDLDLRLRGMKAFIRPSDKIMVFKNTMISDDDLVVRMAEKITIRELGKPVKCPTPTKLLHRRRRYEENIEDDDSMSLDSALSVYFNRRRLLNCQSIFGIAANGVMHYFKVISRAMKSDTCEICEDFEPFLASKLNTDLILSSETDSIFINSDTSRKTSKVRRLPRICESYAFYQQDNCGDNEDPPRLRTISDEKYRHDEERIDSILNGLLSDMPCLITGYNAGDDKRISRMISSACNIVGLREISIDGLAAFSHQSKTPEKTRPHTSGSIVDKISGVKLAFYLARQSAPCVLHFINMHDEFPRTRHQSTTSQISSSNLGDDDDDEEVRVHAAILDELREIECNLPYDLPVNIMSAPPVTLVISSTQMFRYPVGTLFDSGQVIKLNENHTSFRKDELSGGCSRESEREAGIMLRYRNMFDIDKDKMKDDEKMRIVVQHYEKGPISTSNASRSSHGSLIPNIRWDDVGGLGNVRKEIVDAVDTPLKYPQLFVSTVPGDMPFEGVSSKVNQETKHILRRSGLLLYGPPGTGKTLVAKAVASECKLPFLSVKGPELLGSYVGESEGNVRGIFESAREAAALSLYKCAILFFDELDSLAPRRGHMGDGGGVMERVVATLLGELDNTSGKKSAVNVFVIGATNRPDLLDPSLLRPGRLDRLVYLGLARNNNDRSKILEAQMRNFLFEHNMSTSEIVANMIQNVPPMLSGADLSAVASGALMISLRRLCDNIQRQSKMAGVSIGDFVDASDMVNLQANVTKSDLITAARSVVPSVQKSDLVRYEELRNMFGG